MVVTRAAEDTLNKTHRKSPMAGGGKRDSIVILNPPNGVLRYSQIDIGAHLS